MPKLYEVSVFPTTEARTLHGVREIVSVPAPAVGTDWSFTVAGGYYRRLIGGTATLTTSATAGARATALQVTQDGNLLVRLGAPTGITATQVGVISFTMATNTAGALGANAGIPLIWPDLWLDPGQVLGSKTTNLAAGDQWSAILLWFECVERNVLRHLTPRLEIDVEV